MKKIFLLLLKANSLQSIAHEDWLTKAMADVGSVQKASLDSIDFQFAMSVNENSSFFDVQQKGEGWAKGFYSVKSKS